MKERLIELLTDSEIAYAQYLSEKCDKAIKGDITEQLLKRLEFYADYLLENGAIVPPCNCGDTVYYISDNPINLSVQANTIYEATVARIVTTKYGITLVIQIHNSYGCTEIPDMNDWGKTVFYTREEAQKALGGVEE